MGEGDRLRCAQSVSVRAATNRSGLLVGEGTAYAVRSLCPSEPRLTGVVFSWERGTAYAVRGSAGQKTAYVARLGPTVAVNVR